MKGLIKKVTRTHGGLSPYLGVDCSDGTGFNILRRQVSRSQLRDATILFAMNKTKIVGIAKVVSFEEGKGKVKEIAHLAYERFALEDLDEIVDCR